MDTSTRGRERIQEYLNEPATFRMNPSGSQCQFIIDRAPNIGRRCMKSVAVHNEVFCDNHTMAHLNAGTSLTPASPNERRCEYYFLSNSKFIAEERCALPIANDVGAERTCQHHWGITDGESETSVKEKYGFLPQANSRGVPMTRQIHEYRVRRNESVRRANEAAQTNARQRRERLAARARVDSRSANTALQTQQHSARAVISRVQIIPFPPPQIVRERDLQLSQSGVVHSQLLQSVEDPFDDDEDTPPVTIGECSICMSRKRNAVFVPCGHLVSCNGCAVKLGPRAPCPVCRVSIDKVIKIFI